MSLRETLVRLGRRVNIVHAALCTARAGAMVRYPEGQRHAILAMMRCNPDEVETAVTALLASHGWSEIDVEEWRELDVPFLSEDRQVRACYVSAVTSDGGLVVYADPVEDYHDRSTNTL